MLDTGSGGQDENAVATFPLRHVRPRGICPAAIALGKPLVAALQRLRSAIEAERRARRAIIELERLDDRMLRDIGIDRSEIDRAVRGTRAMRTYWHEG